MTSHEIGLPGCASLASLIAERDLLGHGLLGLHDDLDGELAQLLVPRRQQVLALRDVRDGEAAVFRRDGEAANTRTSLSFTFTR